jgi:hypothetical protein
VRKRGLPKSPVRENRTPGSVRGALRRPYRDWPAPSNGAYDKGVVMHCRVTVAGILFLSLCSRSAGVCVCINVGPSQALQSAEAVFTGKVVNIKEDGTALLVVYDSWKGIPPWKDKVEVGTDYYFTDCPYADLKEGQEYLLYTEKGEDQKLATDGCWPNLSLAEAGKDLRELDRRRRRLQRHRR